MSSGTRPCVHPSSLARGDRSRASSLPEPRVRLVVLAELYLVAWVTQTGHRTRNAVNGSGAPGGLGSPMCTQNVCICVFCPQEKEQAEAALAEFKLREEDDTQTLTMAMQQASAPQIYSVRCVLTATLRRWALARDRAMKSASGIHHRLKSACS